MVLITSKKIGDIQVAVTIEETATDELTITEHPVELGAEVSDHAFKRPSELVMKCGWSNADYAALLGAFQALFSGELPTADYVNSVYSQLIALQATRTPFTVQSSRRVYQNMLLKGLTVVTDPKTSAALMVTATLREVIIVNTQATTLPPRENQADPQSTAETQNTGVKAAVPATPAPGGAGAPTSW
ncbi:hypothetical protein RA280_24775 [Cupriavidus sp. CV2]|uniref:phage baseplate protein n=1 Tax=Cupriavidus ulmosensis TaxID=3065913 RepID=UPI00296AFCDB|nr:hypothetical protein [Cupriavidus sp. CV2]MDW3684909.1 hypothetical protein [Cupriavidus sp. CV2]